MISNHYLYNGSMRTGLTAEEAARRLRKQGFNELFQERKQSNFKIFLRVLAEPMLLLLMGCGAIYYLMGEVRDALMLGLSMVGVVTITYYQERKTEKTLSALRNLASPRAIVVRDGKQVRIAGREVVVGDLIMVHEGDRVPADARLLSAENLNIDESLLTGESVAVQKDSQDLAQIFAGTLVVSGRGVAEVSATGAATEMGKIGKSLATIKIEETLLHKETGQMVRAITVVALSLCLIMFLVYAVLRGEVVQGLLSGLTLAMAILPEEFPVVLAIFLAVGAWRISRRKVLTRHSAAIETLGAATVFCTDKTGTLTMNTMRLAALYVAGANYEIGDDWVGVPDECQTLLETGVLASERDPFDPIERELRERGRSCLKKIQTWKLVKEYPASGNLFAIAKVWQTTKRGGYIVAAKGAPESIAELCRTSKKEREQLMRIVQEMSDRGLRVIAGASAQLKPGELPPSQQEFNYKLVGLYGFVDPPRRSVPQAVVEAYQAGIRVIMVTGDYPGTAQYIARKIGMANPERYLTGAELAKMSSAELQEKIKSVNVFARVMPEQKLLIVNALRNNGEIVAMTGDGVNDAPALKAASIGIAMGKRGTDVAREAAELVLLNDNFASIVAAVRTGRRIYDNLRRAMGYLLAVHVPIAGMSLLPLLFNFPLVLFPAHIAFMEFIIDPTCSIVFEADPEDPDIMQRPPRKLTERMFNTRRILINLLQGLVVLAVTFSLFFWIVRAGRGEMVARSYAFSSLVISNLFLIVINLSWKKSVWQILRASNWTLVLVIAGAVTSLAATLYWPVLAELFHLAPLKVQDLLIIVGASAVSVLWFEGVKLMTFFKILDIV